MCFPEAAAGQPPVQIPEKLPSWETYDGACGNERPRTAMDQKASIDYPSLKAEPQRCPVTVAGDSAFYETKAYLLP